MERLESEFAFTNRECTRWLLNEALPEYRLSEDEVSKHVAEMQGIGWDGVRIFDRYGNVPPYVLPGHMELGLAQMIYYDHPVVNENDWLFIRSSLYSMAALYAARAQASLFLHSLAPEEADEAPRHRRILDTMQQFMNRLTTQVGDSAIAQRR
jgi:hypothetical protein